MKKPMIPSSRPCDVAYRIRRYNELLAQAAEFLYAIEPEAIANHGEAERALRAARNAATMLQAPAKKVAKKTPVALPSTPDGIPLDEADILAAAE